MMQFEIKGQNYGVSLRTWNDRFALEWGY